MFQISQASAGVGAGGGGDDHEAVVFNIRVALRKWIREGGPSQLDFPAPRDRSYMEYYWGMSPLLEKNAVILEFETTEEQNEAIARGDDDHVVQVGGSNKVCRGFPRRGETLPRILCLSDKFPMGNSREIAERQFVLVHHEFAGLAGVERNDGPVSDYHLSVQIPRFMHPKTSYVLGPKLGAKPASTVREIANRCFDAVQKIESASDRILPEIDCFQKWVDKVDRDACFEMAGRFELMAFRDHAQGVCFRKWIDKEGRDACFEMAENIASDFFRTEAQVACSKK